MDGRHHPLGRGAGPGVFFRPLEKLTIACRLADTVGMITPSALMDMIETLLIRLPGLALEFHGHYEFYSAQIN